MVAVVMTTYDPGGTPRFSYLHSVLYDWQGNVSCKEDIRFIVADDGSPVTPHILGAGNRVQVITGPHNGIGASLNRALRLVDQNEPWIYTTDDWAPLSVYDGHDALDLDLALWLVREAGYDYVRLGPMHPNVLCYTRFEHPYGWWLDIETSSNQFACATRPFLASPQLMSKIGPWAEGVDSYQAEKDFGDACMHNRVRAASINIHGPWKHIGEYEVGNRPVHG